MPQYMEKAELVRLIESAFKNVALENGIGIFEAETIDNCSSEKNTAKARAKDRMLWKRWTEIPAEVIGAFYSSLSFVDAAGMRFLLPAYMRFAVQNFDTNSSASIDSSIYVLLNHPVFVQSDVDDYFTKAQYIVFALFLRFMVLDVGEDFVDPFCASQAYEKLWFKYDKYMA